MELPYTKFVYGLHAKGISTIDYTRRSLPGVSSDAGSIPAASTKQKPLKINILGGFIML